MKQSRNNILSTLKQSWKKEFDQHFLNIFSTLNIDHVVQLWKFNFRLFFTFNVGSTFNDGLAMKYGLSMVWIQNKLILLNTLEISPEGASWNTSYKTFKHFLFFFSNCGIGPEALKRTINTVIVCQSIETESSVRPKFWTNLLEEWIYSSKYNYHNYLNDKMILHHGIKLKYQNLAPLKSPT